MILTPTRDNIGDVSASVVERTSINDQGVSITLTQEPRRALPERVEFFQSLQEVSQLLRNGSQDQIQGKLDHLDQMLDIVTLSLADIGSEMGSIEAEISINEDLKLQLQTTLSSQEDLDFYLGHHRASGEDDVPRGCTVIVCEDLTIIRV